MFPIIIGIVILSLSGIFFNQVVKIKPAMRGVSTQVEVEASPSEKPEPSPTYKNGTSTSNVIINNNVNTDSETNNSNGSGNNLDLNGFAYSPSSVSSKTSNSLELTSSDDTDKITTWYKEKIKGSRMNTKSFVTTKSNDNVLNKLIGSNGNQEISVEIKKAAGSSSTVITVQSNSL